MQPILHREKNAIYKTDFIKKEDFAQSKLSDFTNAVRVERGITVEQAMEIARNSRIIDYFVYTKGYMMILEIPSDISYDSKKDPLHLVTFGNYIHDNGERSKGGMRVFYQGDVVFFKKEGKLLGEAPGLADVYEKQ